MKIFSSTLNTLATAILFTGTTLLAPFVADGGDPGPSKHPHIIFILADDMGYGDWEGGNPDSKIKTPNLNELAKEGLTFTDGHSAATVCTPSRYGLLTGINPAREGISNTLLKYGNPIIVENTPTIATFLREHGYTTRMVGKWHLGFHMDMSGGRAEFDFSKPFTGGPLDCGFDSYFGTNKAPSGPPHFYIRDRGAVAEPTGEIEKKPGVTDRAMTWLPGAIAPGFVHEEVMPSLLEESLELIRDHAAEKEDKPLFLYLALTAPHTPWVPSKAFQGKSEAGVYGDFVEEIDNLVGKINGALKDGGMEKNTLFIFSSDNGAMNVKEEEKANRSHLSNGVLRGGKAHPYEGGHRVPFIAKWPAVVPASTVTGATVNHTDMFATVVDILGASDSGKYLAGAVDSHSFLPVLKDPGAAFERPTMCNNRSTCRTGDWKIVVSRKALAEEGAPDKSLVELYNLRDDLSETTDLSSENPERLEALVRSYTEFRSQWSLRPEAVQLKQDKADKSKSKSKGRKQNTGDKAQTAAAGQDAGKHARGPGSAPGVLRIPEDVQLNEEQQARVEALVAEYRKRRSELLKRQADLLTDEQKEASAIARKKAIEEGKKGVPLRTATDAGANLTGEQKKQLDALRQEMGEVTREHREQLNEMVAAEPEAKQESPTEKRKP